MRDAKVIRAWPTMCAALIGMCMGSVSVTRASTFAGYPISPSRQVSGCGFLIAFQFNSAELDSVAVTVLRQAYSMLATGAPRRMTIGAYSHRDEPPELADRRGLAIKEFVQAEFQGGRSIELGHFSGGVMNNVEPVAYVGVCPTVDLEHLHIDAPGDPQHLIALSIKGTTLHIPVGYLSIDQWRNTPLETRYLNVVDVQARWPDLRDFTDAPDCLIRMLDCKNHVISMRISSYGSDGSRRRNSEKGDLTLFFPTSGILAGRDRVDASHVQITLDVDRLHDVAGLCRLPTNWSTREDIEAALKRSSTVCYIDGIQLLDNLSLRIEFPGLLLPDVSLIIQRARLLVEPFIDYPDRSAIKGENS